MMKYLAHSGKNDYPAQSYKEHILNVYSNAMKYAAEAETYATKSEQQMQSMVSYSAIWHDLGKLDDQNQEVLHGKSKEKHLPVNHVDAGTAILMEQGDLCPALLVSSHHKGLPNMNKELNRGPNMFRDENISDRNYVNHSLGTLIQRHKGEIQESDNYLEKDYEGDLSVLLRLSLSCLADADHMDTALVYGQAPENEDTPELRAKERLDSLDAYVAALGKSDERSKLRREMYYDCRDSLQEGGFSTCDSPVGSGKTTAVMAHLLQQAINRKSRRIFVILPYTSIITQSVEVYRKALVLPGENPENVVAELHCRADFQDNDTRYLTSLWRAPIIVTTAVAFFETISSNRPATLRRLHELPGSVIFLDESHNCLPVKLLPLAWHWMNVLANEWGCYWILASGSLVRFWQLSSLEKIKMPHQNVPDLVSTSLRNKLMQYENNRISFCWKEKPLSRDELIEWVHHMPGPRLLILNTVQSAAVIADDLCNKYGREYVEHLSTSLDAADRNKTIMRVKKRLKNMEDSDWTLVATSCVEAGVDFSFRTGFREISSLLSLLQASGRVNRHGDIQNAEMWSFSLQDNPMLPPNRGLEVSRTVLLDYFKKDVVITPELSSKAMNDEINYNDVCLKYMEKILEDEEAMEFKTIEDEFKVIDSDTVTVVVDEELCNQIRYGKGDWKLLQQYAVSIRRCKIKSWKVKEIAKDVFQWTLPYDNFLGYMAGVLNLEKIKHDVLTF
jgi:CRISPR-associated endonuclease Cas3-HD